MAGCTLSLSTILPNFVTVCQPAAELLRFVEKFKMSVSAILNLYFSILDHPRSSLVDLKSHSNFGVDRTYTFQNIAILKFWKFGLKRLFRLPKFMFLGVLTPKCYFSLLTMKTPKRHFLFRKHAFWASLVAIRRAVWPGRWAKNAKKNRKG